MSKNPPKTQALCVPDFEDLFRLGQALWRRPAAEWHGA